MIDLLGYKISPLLKPNVRLKQNFDQGFETVAGIILVLSFQVIDPFATYAATSIIVRVRVDPMKNFSVEFDRFDWLILALSQSLRRNFVYWMRF